MSSQGTPSRASRSNQSTPSKRSARTNGASTNGGTATGTATASQDVLHRLDPSNPDEARTGVDTAEDASTSTRRRKRVQNTLDPNIPPVRDTTGEKVQEAFEIFLKK